MLIDGRFDHDFAEIFAASLEKGTHRNMPGTALAMLAVAALGVAAPLCMWVIG